MSISSITIEKRKWDGSISARWTALFRRDGTRALWWTPAGTKKAHPRRGEDELTENHEVSATTGAGWIATAVLTLRWKLVRYAVDATAGGEHELDGTFAFVDLDLDLEITEGSSVVKDLIQFAEHREEMGYPPELLRSALNALEAAGTLHREQDWPFDGSLVRAFAR